MNFFTTNVAESICGQIFCIFFGLFCESVLFVFNVSLFLRELSQEDLSTRSFYVLLTRNFVWRSYASTRLFCLEICHTSTLERL